VITVVAGGAIPMQAEERRPDYKRALSPRRTGWSARHRRSWS